MIFLAGEKAKHKTLGVGIIRETDRKLHPGVDKSFRYFSPEILPHNHASTLLVDVEALEKIDG